MGGPAVWTRSVHAEFYDWRMQIIAIPQWQGAVNERVRAIPEGCRALVALAARLLQVAVNQVIQDGQTSPIEDGLANRCVLARPNRAAQHAAVAGTTEPALGIGDDRGTE